MSKAEEATNDFCTRCFKYSKCSKVQSECTMADSYQEGYEDGYHQAEKDLELSWEDMQLIGEIQFSICYYEYKDKRLPPREQIYKEVLKRFKDYKERKEK